MSCATPPPDLWLCLSPNCTSISCGRAKHQHALEHSQTHRHPSPSNYSTSKSGCVKWIGNQLQPLAEQQKLASLTTCLLASAPESTKTKFERLMHIVEDGDRVFFVSRAFLDVWMRFLVGDEGVPVGGIDNSGLVDESGGRWMKSDLLPLIDFGIVSEVSLISTGILEKLHRLICLAFCRLRGIR
ncbi:hypothetical protein BCR33DRAFT_721655 [Rhizoclosmatium globosum]|uniref:UBP-type domain-containing protein n=1 Tax=Rhizoclosmatium globosum TaxID=329046 RepID=A0A1Y2BQI6_9FUNG|nr:hypothetical protein BCR33DRAFT_721655 [Rhizoclosmatium globosum]|eukprot:ORY37000.1 hypothetical protein BCR33DRAFT_721655 [Rhizoclosmatium globosum]